MRSRAKFFALMTVTVGILILVGATPLLRDRIREEYHIHKVTRGSHVEMLESLERLGQLKCARAVPAILKALDRAKIKPFEYSASIRRDDDSGDFSDALTAMGESAMPALLRGLCDYPEESTQFQIAAIVLLNQWALLEWERNPQRVIGVDMIKDRGRQLIEALASEMDVNEATRQAAAEALKKLQGDKHPAQR